MRKEQIAGDLKIVTNPSLSIFSTHYVPKTPANGFCLKHVFIGIFFVFLITGCTTTNNQLSNRYLINRLENAGSYIEVIKLLNNDYARLSYLNKKMKEVDYFGESYSDAKLRAMKRIVENENAYRSSIIELLELSLKDEEINNSKNVLQKTEREKETEAALEAARLVFNETYTSYVIKLLDHNNISIRQRAIYYFIPNEEFGANYKLFDEETKIRINSIFFERLYNNAEDIRMVKEILSVIIKNRTSSTYILLKKYESDLPVLVKNYRQGLLPINIEEISKLGELLTFYFSQIE